MYTSVVSKVRYETAEVLYRVVNSAREEKCSIANVNKSHLEVLPPTYEEM